jgi:hypothetical protein
LDVDADGQAGPLSDGLMIIRYLAGFQGTAITNGAVNWWFGKRTDPAQIMSFLAGYMPSPGVQAEGPGTDALMPGAGMDALALDAPSENAPSGAGVEAEGVLKNWGGDAEVSDAVAEAGSAAAAGVSQDAALPDLTMLAAMNDADWLTDDIVNGIGIGRSQSLLPRASAPVKAIVLPSLLPPAELDGTA